MKGTPFEHNFDAMLKQLETLSLQADTLPAQQHALFMEVLHELSTALEELQVAGEELRQQNEELAATRQVAEMECQRYQELFDFAPDGYLVTDDRGIILEANRITAALLKVPQDIMVGKPLSVFVAEEDRRAFHTQQDLLNKVQQVKDWELHLQPRGETPFPAAMSVSAVYNPKDRLIALRWLIRDITERKRAEEDLLFIEARQKALLKLYQMVNVPLDEIIMFVVEECVKLSRSAFGFVGFTNADETIMSVHIWSGKTLKHCKIVDKPPQFFIAQAGLWAEPIRQHKPVIVNDYLSANSYKRGLPEGHVSLSRFMGIPVFQGDRTVVVAGVANKEQEYGESDLLQITLLLEGMWGFVQRRKAYEAILRSRDELEIKVEERTSELMESSESLRIEMVQREQAEEATKAEHALREAVENSILTGIIVLDSGGRHIHANPAFCRMVGWSEEELGEMKPPFAYWPSEEIETISKVYQDSITGKILSGSHEFRFQRRNGERFDVLLIHSPLKDARGRLIGRVASVGDITERKKMQRRNDATNRLLSLFITEYSRKNYIDKVIDLIREWCGCRCIGIRVLDETGAIPYESYVGFSNEFWERENWLSLKNDQCACIRVIKEAPEPQDAPVLSPSGSFFCNNTRTFLSGLSKKEQARFRGVCVQTGFQSVAVIPIRYRHKVIAAMHLADEREGMVPLHVLNFIESMANLIGEAVYRFNVENTLQMERNKLKGILDTMPESVCIINQCYEIEYINPAMEKEFGPVQGRTCYVYFHDRTEACSWCDNESIFAGKPVQREWCSPKIGRTYDLFDIPLKNADGSIAKLEIFHDITERKQTEESLKESKSQLRHLSAEILSAHEKERKRVAGEIHDSIGQSLSAIKFRIESVLQQLGKSIGKTRAKPLESLIPMIQAGLEEVRRIQMDLRPSLLDDLGLLATIDWFCREFQTTYSPICIEKEIGIQESEIPESLKIVIYRILGEALNNVVKHSKADLIRLSLQKTDSTIVLTIQDNGEGFDLVKMRAKGRSRKGFGLISMQERTELSGGSFGLESGRETGTVVLSVWPLQKGG